MKRFENPIYITKPLLPDLNDFNQRLKVIWESAWLTNMGRQHQDLELEIKKLLKVNNVSLFNNGTIALITAIQSLRLAGEVITTPFTFAATPHVLSWNGIKPIFCDIDPETLTIDPKKIEPLITPQTTGILGVHVYGTPCHVKPIQAIADNYGLRVIYDACHAFGVEIDQQPVGQFGEISMFSFHATKLFHTAEGGALTYNDHNLKSRIDLLKNFGIKNENEVVMPGINGKMNEIQAALGLEVLGLLDGERAKRELIQSVYISNFQKIPGLRVVSKAKVTKESLQYFVIQIEENEFGVSRDFVYDKLRELNVMVRKYFYPLCSNYSCYQHLPSALASRLPIANKAANEVLALPFYGSLTVETADEISRFITSLRR